MMDIEKEIQDKIDQAIKNLGITVRLDNDGDIEVALHYEGSELSSDFIPMNRVKRVLEKNE